MSDIKQRLQDDMKAAMRAKEKDRLAAIRLIIADIKKFEIDRRGTDAGEVTEADHLAVLTKMAKQRRDSISQYQAANRDDLAAREQNELEIINSYLPQPLSEDEVEAIVSEVIAETGANSVKDMGAVMNHLRSKLQGRADMAKVSQRVKQQLSA